MSAITTTLARPGHAVRPVLTLFLAELRLLFRNSAAWSTAIAIPLVLGGLWVLNDPAFGEGWSAVIVLQMVLLLVFTLHTVGTMTLAARRQQLVLKRWRTSEASDGAVLAGTIAVPTVLTLVQAAVLTAITMGISGERPVAPGLLALGVLVATATVGSLTFVAAAFTRSAEHAMITTFPLLAALFGGAILALNVAPSELATAWLALPGTAAAQLLQLGWQGPAAGAGSLLEQAGPPLAASAALTALGVKLALRTFRWEPRR